MGKIKKTSFFTLSLVLLLFLAACSTNRNVKYIKDTEDTRVTVVQIIQDNQIIKDETWTELKTIPYDDERGYQFVKNDIENHYQNVKGYEISLERSLTNHLVVHTRADYSILDIDAFNKNRELKGNLEDMTDYPKVRESLLEEGYKIIN